MHGRRRYANTRRDRDMTIRQIVWAWARPGLGLLISSVEGPFRLDLTVGKSWVAVKWRQGWLRLPRSNFFTS